MKNAARQAVLLFVLACLPAIVQALHMDGRVPWRERSAGRDEVKVEQAKGWGERVIWIDARAEKDFTAAHIPGALLLNTEEWDKLLPEVLNSWAPDRRLVVYCSKQSCDASREVARRLKDEAGLNNVFVLEGGWEAWQEANR